MNKATTKGGIVLQDIKEGDIHYEYEYGCGIKCRVISTPQRTFSEDGDVVWTWTSINLNSGENINYGVSERYSRYGPNLYDYEAYSGIRYV